MRQLQEDVFAIHGDNQVVFEQQDVETVQRLVFDRSWLRRQPIAALVRKSMETAPSAKVANFCGDAEMRPQAPWSVVVNLCLAAELARGSIGG